jgi:hypothetical protein
MSTYGWKRSQSRCVHPVCCLPVECFSGRRKEAVLQFVENMLSHITLASQRPHRRPLQWLPACEDGLGRGRRRKVSGLTANCKPTLGPPTQRHLTSSPPAAPRSPLSSPDGEGDNHLPRRDPQRAEPRGSQSREHGIAILPRSGKSKHRRMERVRWVGIYAPCTPPRAQNS